MNKIKLTDTFARKYEGNLRRIWDSHVPGFHLAISKKGKKSWSFTQHPWGTKSFGLITVLPCKKAREYAAQFKIKIAAKIDPFEEARERAKSLKAIKNGHQHSITLKQAWMDYTNMYLSTQSDKHFKESVRTMGLHFLPEFGSRYPKDITKREWLALMEKHRDERPAEARRLQSLIVGLYKWMNTQSAYTDHVDNLPPISGFVKPGKRKVRSIETLDDVRRYWLSLSSLSKNLRLAVSFLMLSNKRPVDVRRMTAEDIDFEKAIWTIPGGKYKNGREQVIALTPRLIGLISDALGNRRTGYVFSTNMGDTMVWFGTKISKQLSRNSDTDYISLGDLRRTMSTHLADNDVPFEIREKLRGHQPNGIAAVYEVNNMLKKQREAYLLWEQLVTEG